jgi:SAM-dependent methyltransferase
MPESSRDRWLHTIREIELECALEGIPLDRCASVLELGSGDGYQLSLLCQRFDRVFAIDVKLRPACAEGFCFARAEALPFPDRVFDLVISDSVVEHFSDRRRALEEAVRVLRPGGYMAHVVPTRFWKATSLVLNPLGYPLLVLEKWWALRKAQRHDTGARPAASSRPPRPGFLQVLGRWVRPPIHGTYPSHFAEYRAYARKAWHAVFEHPELARVADDPLISYTQFGLLRFRLMRLRAWAARRGLASSRVIILRKGE